MENFINQVTGFFKTLQVFISYFGDLMTEASTFIPSYVQAALVLFAFVAGLLLILKFVVSVVNFVSSVSGGAILKFLGL